MSKAILLSLATLSSAWLMPLDAQDDLRAVTFNLGGGISTPLNPTATIVGLSGNAVAGAGVNINKRNSIEGDFMWSGLPPTVDFRHPFDFPTGSMNLYSLAANYRFHHDSIHHSILGLYVIGGGGWYFRYASVSRRFTVPPHTVCQPIFNWWGFGCDADGFVVSRPLASRGNSAGGVNAGAGFTLKLGDKGWKFYTEARYTYAWSSFFPTTLIPVTFGLRFN